MQNAVTWIFSIIEYGKVNVLAILELACQIVSGVMDEWRELTNPESHHGGWEMEKNNIDTNHVENPSDLSPVMDDKM
jgi:hypothetical protein